MQSDSFPSRQARGHYRHELRTLTYVTLDGGNGGIVRNLSHDGVAVQAVARLQPDQRVRLRFELRFPRLRVEAHGKVGWSSSTGQCGIRFVDLPDRTSNQIDEWIFSNLLDSVAREAASHRSIFGPSIVSIAPEANGKNSGLILSTVPRAPIALTSSEGTSSRARPDPDTQLNWLSRPLSGRALAWIVDSLVLVAGVLLFALVFLSIAHELPQWQLTLSGALAAAVLVAAAYWTLFAVFGGPSLGVRLAQAAAGLEEEEERDGTNRFR